MQIGIGVGLGFLVMNLERFRIDELLLVFLILKVRLYFREAGFDGFCVFIVVVVEFDIYFRLVRSKVGLFGQGLLVRSDFEYFFIRIFIIEVIFYSIFFVRQDLGDSFLGNLKLNVMSFFFVQVIVILLMVFQRRRFFQYFYF